MITENTNISKLPYRDLDKVTDLLMFERSYLTLFKSKKNDYFLLYLFDSQQEHDEYLFWKVKLLDLYSFLYKTISLRDLILIDSKDFIFIVYSDYESIENLEDQESYFKISQILLEEIQSDWLPKIDSFWDYEIPNQLVSILEDFASENYVEALREKSVYFILEPKGKLNSSTVSIADVAHFLDLLIKSYLPYIVFEYKARFPNLISSDLNPQSSITELKAKLLPRISDSKFGSFEVGLGVDDLNPITSGNKDFFDWQRSALKSYKDEVFEVDFDSSDATNMILEKYPIEIRKEIFNPIYTISNSQRYSVKTTNRLKTYLDELPPITKETKKIITSSDEDSTEIESDQLEYITATMTVKAGESIGDLNKKALQRNLIAVTRSDTTEVKRQESFTLKNKTFTAISPLTLRLAIKGLIQILICDVFSIEIDSTDNTEIYAKLELEIYNYYIIKVINNPRSPEAKIFAIYFNVIDNPS